MFQVRPLATVGAAALCLGVVLAGLGGGTAGADSSGSLATTTTVSAVPTTQPYGVPGQEFVVNVTSSAAPTGTGDGFQRQPAALYKPRYSTRSGPPTPRVRSASTPTTPWR